MSQLEAAVHLAARIVPPATEDTARGVNAKGALFMAVRNDAAAATLSTANGRNSPVAVDSNGRFLVNGSTATQPVSGTVTESSGAAIKAAVEIMDDWDESDRAKVNPIAGQAGVAAGAGAVSALTQRTIEAQAGTATVTQVGDSAASVQLLAAVAGRLGASFFNDSTAIAYLKLGITASTVSYTVKMAAGSFYELPVPVYNGRVDAIWASDAGGVMAVTELT